jgi:hypothetical protein
MLLWLGLVRLQLDVLSLGVSLVQNLKLGLCVFNTRNLSRLRQLFLFHHPNN